MKKLLIILILIITITLSSCTLFKVDYSDFSDKIVNDYYTSEQVSNNRYILYYYDSTDDPSEAVKTDILNFFEDFDALEFYLLDTSNVESNISNFGKYDGEPIIYVISSNEVYESYIGAQEISTFIYDYSNIVFEYSLFESQHITTYQEALEIQNDGYIIYYYFTSCPHCINTKPYFLPWAFTKSAEDIYFMDGSTVENPDQIPTELVILNSGTPILVLMSNGKFANEYYSGSAPVIEYINEVGTGDIIPQENDLDYDDFQDFAFTDFGQMLTISDNLHFEYYYSTYCSHCKSIKLDMLSFLNHLNEVEFYILNTSISTGTPIIENFRGVPALYLVYNNQVVAEYVGSIQIPMFIEAYQNGEIDLSEYE
jgi:uncharacterized protein YxeA